jgi:hypothetical protein
MLAPRRSLSGAAVLFMGERRPVRDWSRKKRLDIRGRLTGLLPAQLSYTRIILSDEPPLHGVTERVRCVVGMLEHMYKTGQLDDNPIEREILAENPLDQAPQGAPIVFG